MLLRPLRRTRPRRDDEGPERSPSPPWFCPCCQPANRALHDPLCISRRVRGEGRVTHCAAKIPLLLLVAIRTRLARYDGAKLLSRVGRYQAGNDKLADEALHKAGAIRAFLQESGGRHHAVCRHAAAAGQAGETTPARCLDQPTTNRRESYPALFTRNARSRLSR